MILSFYNKSISRIMLQIYNFIIMWANLFAVRARKGRFIAEKRSAQCHEVHFLYKKFYGFIKKTYFCVL